MDHDNPYTPYTPCDTDGCERASSYIVSGGFHFCDLHINDKAGRQDRRVSLTLRLPEKTWECLREQAHVERTTITALILDAINHAQTRRVLREMARDGQKAGLYE